MHVRKAWRLVDWAPTVAERRWGDLRLTARYGRYKSSISGMADTIGV